ncbi:MAG: hypothetical protein NTZ17_10215 [Phycisphaerae bacterium]|nr:hypothetical protein [Phycisphaerae bacterium]
MNQKGDHFEVQHKFTVSSPKHWSQSLTLGLPRLVVPSVTQTEDRYLAIQGELRGLSATYSIHISDKETPTILLSQDLYSARGYMIMSETGDLVDVMEKTTDDKTEFRQWRKISEKGTEGG